MRYLTWRLVWDEEHKYGTGPEQTVAASGAFLEASSWTDQGAESGVILGYLTGDVDVSTLSAWSVAELSQGEALAFAQALNADAFIADNGKISSPRVNDLI